MFYVRKIESSYTKDLDDDAETKMFDVTNYVEGIVYLSKIDDRGSIWWTQDRLHAHLFATEADADSAIRAYRKAHGRAGNLAVVRAG